MYSPEMNPIEEVFSYLKAYLRHHGSEFRQAVDNKDELAILLILHTDMYVFFIT
jgi:transposase